VRIAVTVDPYIPVPPVLYGGIERVVHLAVRGLVARGHDVTLFAHPDSDAGAPLVPYGVPPHTGSYARTKELWQLGSQLVGRRNAFDVVVSWGRLAALTPILPLRSLPKIQRYCRNLVPWQSVRRAVRLAGRSISFAGASASVYDEWPQHGDRGGRWFTLYDAIDPAAYELQTTVDAEAPLAFLGRLERIKGAHTAIAIAQRARRRLVIAGNRANDGPEAAYFNEAIAPHLDGEQIRYIGPVDDRAKNQLLRSAAALLFPIAWKEAFGVVMAEAMACGTPVIAYPCGSVPEVVRNGINGFIVSDVEEAAVAVSRLAAIDRSAVRADCEARFSDSVMVSRLLEIIADAVKRA
jgi:glycosyltransferase involved in cell wall biosynthesis